MLRHLGLALRNEENKGKEKKRLREPLLPQRFPDEQIWDKGEVLYFLQHALQHLSIICFEMRQARSAPLFTGRNSSSAARHPKQHFPPLISPVTFGPGFKNSTILRFDLYFLNSSLLAFHHYGTGEQSLSVRCERSAGPQPSAWWERELLCQGTAAPPACIPAWPPARSDVWSCSRASETGADLLVGTNQQVKKQQRWH